MDRPAHNPSFPHLSQNAPERRRAGRIKTLKVSCEWGQVADISSTGLRVIHRGSRPVPENTDATITIRSPLSTFSIQVQVIRVTKLGFRKWQLGLHIIEADDLARAELCTLARAAAQGGSDHN